MGYKVNEKEYDFNSNVNQTIKGDFVGKEVNNCVTGIVDFILRVTRESSISDNYYHDAPFNEDDVENMYIDNSEEISDIQVAIWEVEEKKEELENELLQFEKDLEEEPQRTELRDDINSLLTKIDNFRDIVEDLEEKKDRLETEQEEPREPYEWWSVSSYLCRKLKEHGEIVIPHMNYWGRQTTGQAILLDYEISQICYDLEILEGQQYSWAKEGK